MSDERLIRDLRALDRPIDLDPAFDEALYATLRGELARRRRFRPWLTSLLAAALLAAVIGGAVVVGSRVLPTPIASPMPSASVVPSPSGPATGLAAIVVTEANVPATFTVYRTLTGIEALDASDTAPVGSFGFSDAFLSEFDDDREHAGDHEGRFRTFAAAFETADDAQQAFEAAAASYEAPAGWGPTSVHQSNLPSADQGVRFDTGTDYGYPRLIVYLWRIDALLLQAVDFHPYDHDRAGHFLLQIAQDMATRAGGE